MSKLGSMKFSFILFKSLQILIAIAALFMVITSGMDILIRDTWDDSSVLYIVGGLVAILFIAFNSPEKPVGSDRESEWQKFRNHELILIHMSQLEELTQKWSKNSARSYSDVADLLSSGNYDSSDDMLTKGRSLLRKIRIDIYESIRLGDQKIAENTSRNVLKTIQDTPWMQDWLELVDPGYSQEKP